MIEFFYHCNLVIEKSYKIFIVFIFVSNFHNLFTLNGTFSIKKILPTVGQIWIISVTFF